MASDFFIYGFLALGNHALILHLLKVDALPILMLGPRIKRKMIVRGSLLYLYRSVSGKRTKSNSEILKVIWTVI
jgi:hypothetical protein